MASIEIEWNLSAFRKMRTMPETVAMVDSAAAVVRSRAEAVSPGHPYESRGSVLKGGRRYGAIVRTPPESIRSNAKHNSLLKAIGGEL